MSEAKHTPGPWSVFIDDSGDQWTGWPLSIYAENEEDKTVVRTGGQWPYEWDAATSQVEAVANAHLIAAAPELLEALKEMLAEKDDYMRRNKLGDPLRETVSKMARAAIAKAEGRSR